MEQPTKTHNAATWRRHRFPIEEYALLTESAPGLRGKLEEWYGYYRPATPGECELLEMAVMSSIQGRRVDACLTETVNQAIRTAVFDLDCAAEDEVERYRGMLATQPGKALVGLKRSALGIRFLIQRWERLLRLLRAEGTWYGNDRDEVINYQGAKASTPENLYASEGAFLTWVYCLLIQPDCKDKEFKDLSGEHVMPKALRDRKPEHWLPLREQCRQLLDELAERELGLLRQREEYLRLNHEEPARDGAEIRKQVHGGPDGALLLRHMRTHAQHFHRAYQAFLNGRKESTRTGRLPGAPHPDIHDETDDTTAVEPEPKPDTVAVKQAQAARKQGADAVAPGAANGIGAPIASGDIMREATTATALTREQPDADAPAEAEENVEPPAASAVEPGGIFAKSL